jgi:DNA helicase-2/ATP-dependent DNA helicase PcrA
MKYYADLHIHSKHSRATSPQLDIEHLWLWAQIKGIQVVATGDFTHPGWMEELKQKLEPGADGFLHVKPEFLSAVTKQVPAHSRGAVRFVLSGEISNIYKRDGKVRKVHNLVYAPDFATAGAIQARLEEIGNIRSDGRPILGLDSRNLLEIVLEAHPDAFLIPAHIWTPWFSALGSKSGFDRIDDCYADLAAHIFAAETGLSSDPSMNWRLSSLDRCIMVSNSDAHSPQKLGREANLFDTDFSYAAMLKALRDPADTGLAATVEFFPEEGKYHWDGHRKCGQRLHPRESAKNNGLCPECGKPITVGVMARVEELADRPDGAKSARWRPYHNLIPLTEVIGDSLGVGPASVKVEECYNRLVANVGNEFSILRDAPIDAIAKHAGAVVAEGVRRVRDGAVEVKAGYDGEYGIISIFSEAERAALKGQASMFNETRNSAPREKKRSKTHTGTQESGVGYGPAPKKGGDSPAASKGSGQAAGAAALNAAQQAAVEYRGAYQLIIAGPGAGKTHTLTRRIERTAASCGPGEQILAITFTNKAAEEMRGRIMTRIGRHALDTITVGTFHQFCMHLLRTYPEQATVPREFTIATQEQREAIAAHVWSELTPAKRREMLEVVSRAKSTAGESETAPEVELYTRQLRKAGLLDFDDLLVVAVRMLANNALVRAEVQRSYRNIFVDEYQDINAVQHELLKLLVGEGVRLTAIGDPNQAIYGFRGADLRFFERFSESFPSAATHFLTDNYRTAQNLLAACGQVISSRGSLNVPPLTAQLFLDGKLIIQSAPTDKAEAEYVVHQIEKLVGGTSMFSQDSGRVDVDDNAERSFGDCAVLYRLKAQRHALMEAFERSGIPFQVAGDRPLHEHPFVADIITMLRLGVCTPVSAEEIGRTLQRFVYGFGDMAREAAIEILKGTPARVADVAGLTGNSRIVEPLQQGIAVFAAMLADIGRGSTVATALDSIERWPGFSDILSAEKNGEEVWRRLRRMAHAQPALHGFIDYLHVQSADDTLETQAEKVTLLTLHAAKGLEFPVVFITGCEEGLIPLALDGRESDDEEERRLLYVGMTRAKERLYLIHAHHRMLFGRSATPRLSPFIADIEEELKTYEAAHRRAKRGKDVEQMSLF